MTIRPHLLDVGDDDQPACRAAVPTAGSNEPFQKPDYRAKRHPRPTGPRRKRWERRERHEWVAA